MDIEGFVPKAKPTYIFQMPFQGLCCTILSRIIKDVFEVEHFSIAIS